MNYYQYLVYQYYFCLLLCLPNRYAHLLICKLAIFITINQIFLFLSFFSRMLRDTTPRFVCPSVRRSVLFSVRENAHLSASRKCVCARVTRVYEAGVVTTGHLINNYLAQVSFCLFHLCFLSNLLRFG